MSSQKKLNSDHYTSHEDYFEAEEPEKRIFSFYLRTDQGKELQKRADKSASKLLRSILDKFLGDPHE